MKKTPSDFTEDIEKEVSGAQPMPVENDFHDIREIYVSKNGHTRLFYATRYGKRYALKCLKEDFLYTPVYRQLLTKEFDIGLQLEHPYICHTIGMENVKGYGPVIIMDYVDGSTLQQVIEARQLTKPLAWKIFRQLSDALSYMHSKQIYHRDLKPQNIMVTHVGNNVRLIDFSLSDSEAFSVLKEPAGTIGYIAPEQLQHGATADARADIYSLGKVLLDMAEACGDKKMKRIGTVCASEDPTQRPQTIEEVRLLTKEDKQRKWINVLLLLCAVLALLIVIGLQRRFVPTKKSPTTYQTVTPDSNVVRDFNK